MASIVFLLCFSLFRLRRGAHCDDLKNLNFLGRPGGCMEDKDSYPGAPGATNATGPFFTMQELRLWECYLASAKTYFEFGMGGSTYHALHHYPNLERIHSVDLNWKWRDSLATQPEISTWISDGRAFLEVVDVGPVSPWSNPLWNSTRCGTRWRRRRYPRDFSNVDRDKHRHRFIRAPERNDSFCKRWHWPKASDALLRAGESSQWDVILIDGRFRVATFLKSLLAITRKQPMIKGCSDGPVILLHDFDDDRPSYRAVEAFADMEACAGCMAAFRPKKVADIDYDDLNWMIAATQYDPT